MNKEQFEEFKNNLIKLNEQDLIYALPVVKHISKEAFDAAQFLFWIIYDIELQLKNITLDAMLIDKKDNGEETKEFIENIFEELSLGGKIRFLEKNFKKEAEITKYDGYKDLIKFLQELNTIRNTLFHQKIRVQEIKYRKKLISERSTRDQMIIDLVSSLNKCDMK